jgi:sulfur carrier protein ThiS
LTIFQQYLNGGIVVLLDSLVSDIVERLPIVSSGFVVTVNGGVVVLLVSLASDIVEVLPIVSSRFVVTQHRHFV